MDIGKLPQEFVARQAAALSPQMAGGMIDNAFGKVALRLEQELAAFDAVQQESLGIQHMWRAGLRKVREEFRHILIEHEHAARAGGDDGNALFLHTPHGAQITFCVGLGVVGKAVGDHGQAAAGEFLWNNHFVARAIEEPDKVKAGLRIIDVYEAAREKGDLAGQHALIGPGQPIPEACGRKGGQRRVGGNADFVQHLARQRIEHAEVLEPGRQGAQQLGQQFAVPQHPVAQGGLVGTAVVGAGHHVEGGDRHAVRAGNIAVFAVGAVVQRFFLVQPQQAETFVGRADEARSQIVGRCPGYGAVDHAGGAGNAGIRCGMMCAHDKVP